MSASSLTSPTWTALAAPAAALGESPFWHPEEQALYWVDIPAATVHRWLAASGQHRQWSLPAEVGCIAPWPGRGLVAALRDGWYRLDTATGQHERLLPAPYDPSDTRFNDGRCDSAGRFWAGTLYEPKTAELGALYHLSRNAQGDWACTLAAQGNITANGLAFSPDGRLAYWAHTAAHRVDVFDCDPATGQLSGRRVFHQFAPRTAGQPYGGRPDGACVDSRGHYWVAMYEGAAVVELSPEGRLLQRLAVPVSCPTMPCIGGSDGHTLYLTTARKGRPAEELAAQPLAGHVLSLRLPSVVEGLPVAVFKG